MRNTSGIEDSEREDEGKSDKSKSDVNTMTEEEINQRQLRK